MRAQRCCGVVFAALMMGAVLAACATAPVEETKAFVTAAGAVKSTTDAILDEFDIAEKNYFLRKHKGDSVFRVADAYYYSTISEAPDTIRYRRALLVLESYAQLLKALVEGDNIDAARGQIDTLAANVATLSADPAIKVAVGELSGVIDQLIAAANIAEAKRIAIAAEPAIHKLIAALRAAAPSMYRFLTIDDRSSPTGDIQKRLAAERVVVANYVVLLDRLEETYDRLMIAFEHPSNASSLAALVEASTALTKDVESARKALAALRRT